MSATREKAQLMSASEMDRTMVRLAHEVLEKTDDLSKLAFIGIRRRGVPVAQRLAKKIESLEKIQVPVGVLDIKLYRDDLSQVDEKPVVSDTKIDFNVSGMDVGCRWTMFCTRDGPSGRRWTRASNLGRPARVQLLVLIDRGHRELPIEAQYIGRKVPTSSREIIEVKFQEVDQLEKVLLVEKVD